MTTDQFERSPDAISVDVGTDGDLHGRTRMVLAREGGALETFRDGKQDILRLDVSAAEAADIFEAAAQFRGPTSEVRTRVRRGIPDEPRYHITLRLGGAVRFDGELWRSEVEADPVLARVLARLQTIAYDRSAGRALL
jgi:hypothetical protein